MRTHGSILRLFVALCALLALTACGDDDDDATTTGSDSAIAVVATTTQIADLARNVAGERAEISGLLPANADAHDFEPTPRDVAKVADADLVLVHSMQLDEWT